MIVSWNWLQDFVQIPWSVDELTRALSMSGLNHESTTPAADDWAIDLEVTSNRPDCLGHVGVAREIAVLVQRPLQVPTPSPPEELVDVEQLARVRIDCPQLCSRYTARVIRGVRIGTSPEWLQERLAAIGVHSVNNVVDATNYVMFECGQPLHAFDLQQLSGAEIIVREAEAGEQFTAIDHRTYTLTPGMCLITDPQAAVAIGGVMGGAQSEVSATTTDVLLEAARFDPLSIRNTARALNLHSPSSYRFERGIDPDVVDWASRRCCELILEVAGGELAAGMIDVHPSPPPARPAIQLRWSQLPRVLGIKVPAARCQEILEALGMRTVGRDGDHLEVIAPSWRGDVKREIDLVEEIARIHGYDQIPENTAVPTMASQRPAIDPVLERIRRTLVATGFHEAMTASVVTSESWQAFSPWTRFAPLATSTPMLRGADQLRQSLIPSLLAARRENEKLGNAVIELFETAKVYLPTGDHSLPEEPIMVGITSGRSFLEVKGILETLWSELSPGGELDLARCQLPLCDDQHAVEIRVQETFIGFLGELHEAGRSAFGLQERTSVAELRLDALASLAVTRATYTPPPTQPAIERDLNLILSESTLWAAVAQTVRNHGTELLESITYRETYRDPQKDGEDRKRCLFSLRFRAPDRTLTGQEADSICQKIVVGCQRDHAAILLS